MRPACLFAALALALLPACGDDTPPKTDDTPPADTSADGAPPASSGAAGRAQTGLDEGLRGEIAAAMAEGRAFLLTQQGDKGGFGDKQNEIPPSVSYTGMGVLGVIAATPRTQVGKDPAIRRGLAYIAGFAQSDGAIMDNPTFTNYSTGISVSAFAAARIAEFAKLQAAGADYLAGSQIVGAESDMNHGGFPYKQDQGNSADGSNAFISTNALDANGLPADSPVRKRTEAFVSKIQNHSESNPGERRVTVDDEERVVVSSNDGGAYYRPDESKAGMVKRSDGRWEMRSYGSMTYAALKLLLFAGVSPQDPRMKALIERWVANNWTVERNPGFEGADDPQQASQQGYFYYLYSMARALDAYEEATGKPLVVRDADGRSHNWRAEIARALLARQAEDGSWQNEVATRWEEGSKTLATGFAMQTLGYVTGRLD